MQRLWKLKSLKYKCAVAALTFAIGGPGAACQLDIVDLRSDTGKARFKVQIADDDAERAQGLMHVEKMPRFSGMLFVYDEPLHAYFWMKNTLIPLDMLFIDETGVVTHVHENAVPHSLESIDGGENVLAVLEVNGGLSRLLGLGVGTQIRHPAFNQTTAIWPCGS